MTTKSKEMTQLAYDLVELKTTDISDPDPSLGQRPPNLKRVAKMAKNFRPELFRPLVCARVRGRAGIHPADGGHELVTAKLLKMATVPALLSKQELTKEQFAALVSRLNTERKSLSAWEKFHAAVTSSPDEFPDVHGLQKVLSEFKFSQSVVKGCISDLLNLYRDGGTDRTRDVFRVLSEAFNGEPYAFQNGIPRSLGDFFGRYGQQVNRDFLIRRMDGFNVAGAMGAALSKAMKEGKTKGARFVILAEMIKRRYNTSRPSGVKRLRLAVNVRKEKPEEVTG